MDFAYDLFCTISKFRIGTEKQFERAATLFDQMTAVTRACGDFGTEESAFLDV